MSTEDALVTIACSLLVHSGSASPQFFGRSRVPMATSAATNVSRPSALNRGKRSLVGCAHLFGKLESANGFWTQKSPATFGGGRSTSDPIIPSVLICDSHPAPARRSPSCQRHASFRRRSRDGLPR